MKLKKRLEKGAVVCAEGYLFELERRGYLRAGPFVPEVVLDNPEAVQQLHREFLRAGSDVIEAFTYYAHRDKMKVIGREDDLENLNRQALRIARKVADEGDALMAGNICNTWVYNPADKETHKEVRNMYREQVAWAKEEGADFIIAETIEYFGEAQIALEIIQEFGLESVVNLSSHADTLRDDYTYAEACKRLQEQGADVVGLNCTRGPETMLPILQDIREVYDGPLAALPVPYRTTPAEPTMQQLRENGKRVFPVHLDPFTCTRSDIAEFGKQCQDLQIEFVGLCCGAAPHHIRALSESYGKTTEASKYGPDLGKHAMLGNITRDHDKPHVPAWKD